VEKEVLNLPEHLISPPFLWGSRLRVVLYESLFVILFCFFLVIVLSVLNTVVSNHFHSVKILLFSSARSHDFDGTPGTELPVSMYTTKTPIDMCYFNVQSST
jgi:sensor histidine kinase YesM